MHIEAVLEPRQMARLVLPVADRRLLAPIAPPQRILRRIRGAREEEGQLRWPTIARLDRLLRHAAHDAVGLRGGRVQQEVDGLI